MIWILFDCDQGYSHRWTTLKRIELINLSLWNVPHDIQALDSCFISWWIFLAWCWTPAALRFCCANVISFGQTFCELILQATSLIKQKMQVVYVKPDPSWSFFSQRIAELSLKELRKPKDSDDSGSEERRKRIQLFLDIFNSDWKSPTLRHHCSVYCPCGGLPQAELAELAASLFVEVVFFSRPPIPALNRWLKCSATARWFASLGRWKNGAAGGLSGNMCLHR